MKQIDTWLILLVACCSFWQARLKYKCSDFWFIFLWLQCIIVGKLGESVKYWCNGSIALLLSSETAPFHMWVPDMHEGTLNVCKVLTIYACVQWYQLFMTLNQMGLWEGFYGARYSHLVWSSKGHFKIISPQKFLCSKNALRVWFSAMHLNRICEIASTAVINI